ncbi:MAG TPA: MFS transporter [Ktedonobacterales bacterium]|nr:MFS transporter [Ktedonobacterales bacterium]
MRRAGRSPLLLMALTVFIDITGFGLILPLLPFWAERLGAGPVGVTLIVTAYALAQFLFTPLLGSLSDRYGRRPIILLSLLVEAFAFAWTALAGSLPLLLAARFIGGLGASNIGSAQAVVADVTPPEGRARGMGLIGAAIGLGFVVGPALGGVLSSLGAALPFWAAMGVALANALLVLAFLPETRQLRAERTPDAPARQEARTLFAGWGRTLRQPGVARLAAISLLFTLAFTAMEAVFPLFSQRVYGWTAEQNGYIFTYVGVMIVIMQGWLVGRLVKRLGEQRLLMAGLALLAVGLALLPISTRLAVLLVALGILSAGEGAVTPTSSALLSFASPPDAQGETLGLAQGVAGLGRIVGPLLAGVLFTVGVGVPFIAGAVLLALAAVLVVPALPRAQRPEAASPAWLIPAESDLARDEQEVFTGSN